MSFVHLATLGSPHFHHLSFLCPGDSSGIQGRLGAVGLEHRGAVLRHRDGWGSNYVGGFSHSRAASCSRTRGSDSFQQPGPPAGPLVTAAAAGAPAAVNSPHKHLISLLSQALCPSRDWHIFMWGPCHYKQIGKKEKKKKKACKALAR